MAVSGDTSLMEGLARAGVAVAAMMAMMLRVRIVMFLSGSVFVLGAVFAAVMRNIWGLKKGLKPLLSPL